MSANSQHGLSPSGADTYTPFNLRSTRVSTNKLAPRIAAFSVAFVTACSFAYLLSASYGATIHTRLEKYRYHSDSKDRTSFAKLYDSIRHPIGADTYIDASSHVFGIHDGGPYWTESLGQNVLIVDIDTRVPQGPNEVWSNGSINWEALESDNDGGMITASQMNHFLYAQIHDYDYRFIQAEELDGLHNTWVKPHILLQLLRSYQFVVFIDADATIQHLEVPFEWMFNRWGVTPSTSIAMPFDTRMQNDPRVEDDAHHKMELNTGLIVAQALSLTFEMLTAWKDCPTEVQYPGCSRWKEEWGHEQRAFSKYIRYDYNPNSNNVVEIPCDDAMGYPGLGDLDLIVDNCTGQFIRHHTVSKDMTKRSTEIAVLQTVMSIARMELLAKRDSYLVQENQLEERW